MQVNPSANNVPRAREPGFSAVRLIGVPARPARRIPPIQARCHAILYIIICGDINYDL
jgi:hypothetical protein